VKGLILEVAACIVALFYSIFGLKPYSNNGQNLSEIESRLEELEARVYLTAQEISEKPNQMDTSNEQVSSVGREFMYEMYPFLKSIDEYDVSPPFDRTEYSVSPSYSEIAEDISKAKPFEKESRTNCYIGLKVQWKCAYGSITEKEDYFGIHFNTERPLFGAYIELDKGKNISKLKILEKNHPLWVCGEISDLSGINVELRNADIYVE
jgi:hypothetical protein